MSPTDTPAVPVPPDGGQGGRRLLPSGQPAPLATGTREYRRVRLIARASLREARARLTLARDTDRAAMQGDIRESLEFLRAIVQEGSEKVTVTELTKDGVEAKVARKIVQAKRRQAQLAAGDILHHHRMMAKLSERQAPIDDSPAGGDRHLHLHVHAPSDPAQERLLMAGFAQAVIESEGVIPEEEPAVVEEADPADEPA